MRPLPAPLIKDGRDGDCEVSKPALPAGNCRSAWLVTAAAIHSLATNLYRLATGRYDMANAEMNTTVFNQGLKAPSYEHPSLSHYHVPSTLRNFNTRAKGTGGGGPVQSRW
jgi:hypothetical protein